MTKPDNDTDPRADTDWWRGGVIYQIYPRSFLDTNGDGVGDLPGILAKLDYVAALGVDAVWISPFFKSPMADFGYDVSDYRTVDPMFGTNADFEALLDRAHALGLKIVIDQVLNHTSDQHAWFQDSQRGRDGDRADWYVWADPRPDGTPPNNWLSLFGGPAWEWNSRRGQYYLHNFLASQPDLNFHCPALVDQLLAEVEHWLAAGVDGFRLDTVNFYVHDAKLRDNPAGGARDGRGDGIPATNPYAFQKHVYDKTRPENLAFLRKLRAVVDRYPGAVTLGEIGDDDPIGVLAEYTAGSDKLHMGYTFDLLTDEFDAGHVRRVIEAVERRIGDGWVCWSLGNHDVTRVATRWGGHADAAAAPGLAKLAMALLLSLRGSACIYQGDELGLPEADVPFERMRDPYGLRLWPEYKGRDGCRTPMPWRNGAPHAGFSTVEPWLPVAAPHHALAVDTQDGDPASVLSAYRTFVAWRRGQPALRSGAIELVDAPDPVVAFIRAPGAGAGAGAGPPASAILAAFNLSDRDARLPLSPALAAVTPLTGHGFAPAAISAGQLALPPHGAFFGALSAAR